MIIRSLQNFSEFKYDIDGSIQSIYKYINLIIQKYNKIINQPEKYNHIPKYATKWYQKLYFELLKKRVRTVQERVEPNKSGLGWVNRLGRSGERVSPDPLINPKLEPDCWKCARAKFRHDGRWWESMTVELLTAKTKATTVKWTVAGRGRKRSSAMTVELRAGPINQRCLKASQWSQKLSDNLVNATGWSVTATTSVADRNLSPKQTGSGGWYSGWWPIVDGLGTGVYSWRWRWRGWWRYRWLELRSARIRPKGGGQKMIKGRWRRSWS